jgi:PepSY-associated TM region
MSGILWRTLVVLHRYLGVAIGLLMAMWFVSGIVMMYVGFPRFTEPERVSALAAIPWQDCCRVPDKLFPDDLALGGAQIETILGSPVLRLRRPPRPDLVIDLAEGVGVRAFTAADALAIVRDAAPRMAGAPAAVAAADTIDEDQWTIGRYRRDRPLHRLSLDDGARTTLYVSSTSGAIVLRTTARERFWNWLGAVPHWLYFTALRTDGPLWNDVVVWTSILGCFLTVIGLYLGIAQFRRGRNGAVSPYRGLFWWHHLAGLVFGLIILTFVASGLVSMNPWGFLEGHGGGELLRAEGAALRWGAIRASIAAMQTQSPNAVSLSTARLDGKLYWLATAADGTRTRLDAAGRPAPLPQDELAAAAARIAGDTPIAAQGILDAEDAYYFNHHDEVTLPVYRMILDNADQTRYYIDPTSGAPLRRADTDSRWYRWLFSAPHRLDFAAALRARPVWDIVTIALLLGGLAGAATGVWLAIRRIRQDIVMLYRLLRRSGSTRATQGARSL